MKQNIRADKRKEREAELAIEEIYSGFLNKPKRICRSCNEPFEQESRRGRPSVDCPSCKEKGMRVRKVGTEKILARGKSQTSICEVCGNEFEQSHGRGRPAKKCVQCRVSVAGTRPRNSRKSIGRIGRSFRPNWNDDSDQEEIENALKRRVIRVLRPTIGDTVEILVKYVYEFRFTKQGKLEIHFIEGELTDKGIAGRGSRCVYPENIKEIV